MVSTTNRNLKQDVEQGTFRQDHYYRATGLNLSLPALRERTDKEALVKFLLARYALENETPAISLEVLATFKNHPWPDNIRQMVSVLEIAVAMADNHTITVEHLPDDFLQDLEPEYPEHGAHQGDNITLLSDVTTLKIPDDNWLEIYE